MGCQRCNHVNPADAKFCQNCGEPLLTACASCGTRNELGSHFCKNCGQDLSTLAEAEPSSRLWEIRQSTPKGLQEKMLAARSQLDGERRPVTILFTDIVGSTSIASSLDPEDWRDIVAGVHKRVSEAIYRYEGTITQLLGDGVLAFFGAPIAHEDDPVRAVHAALDIQESLSEYSRQIVGLGTDLQVRAGINTGNVVIGDIGTDMHVEYLAFGDAVNVASRLEGAAKPGTVVVSEGTHKLISHNFKTLSLGEFQFKGIADPTSAFRVISSKVKLRKLRGIEGLRSPLVGRKREYDTLLRSINELKQGKGGITYITGEAGLGKSRLVAEIRKVALTEGLAWVEGRCLSYSGSISLSLWQELLKDLISKQISAPFILDRTYLLDWLNELCPDHLESTFAFLGRLLTLPLDDENKRMVGSLDGEELKTATFHAVETVIGCSASSRPLVLVCEDLHWADPSSLELLGGLFAFVLDLPLLILCVTRPEVGHASWELQEAALNRFSEVYKEISLHPLTGDEGKDLVENILSIGVSPEFYPRIMDLAEGNPFYVEEIIRSLIENQSLVHDEPSDAWQIVGEIGELSIPDTLHGVLLARIDRLDTTSKRILQRAAVIGRIFEPELLEYLSPSPIENLKQELTLLEHHEFIRPYIGATSPGYIFNHALTHEAAYQSLLRKKRKILHAQVGEAIEAHHPESLDEYVELLALHYAEGQVWDKAWRYQLESGRKAKTHFANQEALEYLQGAVEVSTHLPQLDTLDLVEVHILLADVYCAINQYEEAEDELELAIELAGNIRTAEDRDLILAQLEHKRSIVLRNSGEYAHAIEAIKAGLEQLPDDHHKEEGALKIAMASALTRMGDLVEAQSWCEEGILVTELGGDLAELAHAYSLLGTIYRDQGNSLASLTSRKKSLEISENIESIPLQMEAHNNLAVDYYDRGDLDLAIDHYQRSKAFSELIGNVNTAARADINIGEVVLIRGDWASAKEAFKRALATWERTGYQLGQAYAASNVGAVLTKEGQPEWALEYLTRSESLFTELEARGFLPIVYRHQAEAYLRSGDLETAEKKCTKALKLANELSMAQEVGFALRIQGMILRRTGDLPQADEALEQSVAIFEEAGVQYEKARSTVELMRVREQRGDLDRIKAPLEEAIQVFTELGAKRDLELARELSSGLSK